MQIIGIMVACTIRLASGDVIQAVGMETNERNTKHGEQILFVADDQAIAPQWVSSNNCLYKEDPVVAYQRNVKLRQAQARALAGIKIEPVVEGTEKYCWVDGYGMAKCFYKTIDACTKRISAKWEYCIERKNLEESNAGR